MFLGGSDLFHEENRFVETFIFMLRCWWVVIAVTAGRILVLVTLLYLVVSDEKRGFPTDMLSQQSFCYSLGSYAASRTDSDGQHD